MSIIQSEHWTHLYRDHAARVRRTLQSRLGRAAVARARRGELDDMVQDVFTRALSSKTLFTSECDPLPYLLTIARNRWIDWIRSRRHPAAAALPLEMVAEGEPAMLAPPEEDEALDHQRHVRVVARYVASLSGDLLIVYEARFVKGLSQRDAAELAGMTRRRIRTLEQNLLELVATELEQPHSAYVS